MSLRAPSLALILLAACHAPTPSSAPSTPSAPPVASAVPAFVRAERATLEACAKDHPSAVRITLRYDGERVALESCDALDAKSSSTSRRPRHRGWARGSLSKALPIATRHGAWRRTHHSPARLSKRLRPMAHSRTRRTRPRAPRPRVSRKSCTPPRRAVPLRGATIRPASPAARARRSAWPASCGREAHGSRANTALATAINTVSASMIAVGTQAMKGRSAASCFAAGTSRARR